MKKLMIFLTILGLTLAVLCGCGEKPYEEEGAAPSDVVETDPNQENKEPDLPDKVETEPENTPVKDSAPKEPSTTPSTETKPEPEPEPESEPKQEQEPETPPAQSEEAEVQALKVLSYNLGGEKVSSGEPVTVRFGRLKKIVSSYSPALMGFHEADGAWQKNLSDSYSAKYDSYTAKGNTAIFWKKDLLEAVNKGCFELSALPNAVRTVSWVELKVKDTGNTFVYLFGQLGEDPAKHGEIMKALAEEAKKQGCFGSVPMILWLGAENLQTPMYDYELTNVSFSDNGGTLHKFNNASHEGDYFYVYLEDELFAEDLVTVRDTVDGKYVSDRYGALLTFSVM